MLKVLIVEDEQHNRGALSEILVKQGYSVSVRENGRLAFELCLKQSFDVVLSDIRMPEVSGIELFELLKQAHRGRVINDMPYFIFMTAYGKLSEAVELMKKGAMHFLIKPLRKKELIASLGEVELLLKHNRVPKTPESIDSSFVFESKKMRDLLETAERIAASNVPVMIVGESGTGKEMLARFIHAKSARSLQPFVAVNMSSIPENLVESELFGHTKGSFTGATQNKLGLIQTAHNGSFFMDEIESMPLAAQSKLLRVVQDGKIQPIGALEPMHCQVRWISASNRKMSELIQNGLFREDLFFRLGVVVIDVPPLRERSEDVIALARSYLRIFSLSEKRPELELTAETTEILLKYQWPGNVRELKNVIERACVLAKGDVFAPDLLPEHMRLKALNREIRIPLGSSLENAENKLFAETLKLCDGDKAKAAQILGVNLRTIYRWMDKQPTDLQ